MRELDKEFKELRLYGMAGAWEDLVKQGGHATLESSRWLLEHLLQAEVTDRAMRSVSYQMHTAKFPVHRDLAGFDFECSPLDKKLIEQLASMAFAAPSRRTTWCWWAGLAQARRTWPRPSGCRASRAMVRGYGSTCMYQTSTWAMTSSAVVREYGSTRQSIWSTHWSRRRRRARPDASLG